MAVKWRGGEWETHGVVTMAATASENAAPMFPVLLLLLFFQCSLLASPTAADPRATEAALICGARRAADAVPFVQNFVSDMAGLADLVSSNGWAAHLANSSNSSSSSPPSSSPVYGLAQCHSDLSPTDCLLCFSECRTRLPRCLPNVSARVFLDGCFVRYDSYDFYSEAVDPALDRALCGGAPVEGGRGKEDAWRISVVRLLGNLTETAAGNGGFGVWEDSAAGVYGLAECWETVGEEGCRECLGKAGREVEGCLPAREGRGLNAGCYLRYSDSKFYGDRQIAGDGGHQFTANCENLLNHLIPNQSISLNAKEKGLGIAIVAAVANELKFQVGQWLRYFNPQLHIAFTNCNCPFFNSVTGGSKKVLIFALVPSIACMVFLSTLSVWIYHRRKKRKTESKHLVKISAPTSKSQLYFKYETLEKATDHFNPTNKLGQGGAGSVYKGTLPDGRNVAVKRLFFNTRQWADDFFNEVNLISNLQHKNLVKLLGCSIEGPESLLVYEYIPNKSLDNFLFDRGNIPLLTWKQKLQIIVGIAEGSAYLHQGPETRIVHRDIKCSNILLDENLNARIADFGLARRFPVDQTHLSTGIAGTLGYLAPEYLVRGILTEKADVYSFGVLVLEVVCGRKNIHAQESSSVLQTVWKHYTSRTLVESLDKRLTDVIPAEEASHALQVGLLCTQASISLRPSMLDVVKMLTSMNCCLPMPTQPPFINTSLVDTNPS